MRVSASLGLLFFFLSSGVSAQPTIVSVTPSSGRASGGTVITIKGSNFSDVCSTCSPPVPPLVFIGGVAAQDVVRVDSTTLTARTASHLPGRFDVYVEQLKDGHATLAGAFEYTGPVDDGLDRVLLPIFLPPVQGAFGSEFRTAFQMQNISGVRRSMYGLDIKCFMTCPWRDPLTDPLSLESGEPMTEWALIMNGHPGRLFYLARGESADLVANLRAYDVSRNASSFGTQIPVVREADFREDRIVLLGVPVDENFRNTLRIYSDRPDAGTVEITVGSHPPVTVELAQGRDIFDPAYAMFTDFPTEAGSPPQTDQTPTTSVVIQLAHSLADPPPQFPQRIWAFVTATNNTTQEITTVAPQ